MFAEFYTLLLKVGTFQSPEDWQIQAVQFRLLASKDQGRILQCDPQSFFFFSGIIISRHYVLLRFPLKNVCSS